MNNTIPAGQPSLFDPIRSLSQLRQQAIIRPNNPPPGIAGFLFDIPLEDRISLSSSITDYAVEDNTTIQDQIALMPEEISVRGLVAELVLTAQQLATTQTVTNPLGATPGMTPPLTTGGTQASAQKAATTAGTDAAAATQNSLYGYYNSTASGPPDQTKQSKAFGYFYQLWLGRQLFSVETPWGFMTSMGITKIDVVQSEKSKENSELAINFKRVTIAQEVTVNVGQLAGRAEFQQAPATNNGNAGLQPAPVQSDGNVSWLDAISKIFKGN